MAGKADSMRAPQPRQTADGHFVHERLRLGRWVPPWLRHQSEGRYAWAAGYVARRRVLEIGCGSGHGARQLCAAGAASVDACDASAEAIDVARAASSDPRLRFQVVTSERLPYDDATFDLVVSLETIEHVVDDAWFVSEAARVLARKGLLLCSTPNRDVTNPGTSLSSRPYNSAHVREYASEEFVTLLRRSFQNVTLWGQTPWSEGHVARLAFVGRRWPPAAVRLHQMRKLLGMWADTPARHAPRPLPPTMHAEVLVALATK